MKQSPIIFPLFGYDELTMTIQKKCHCNTIPHCSNGIDISHNIIDCLLAKPSREIQL